MNLPVKQKHFLSFSRKLFLSVISLFLVFAFCFIAYQYQREREYKVELLNTQLQNYNSRLYERLNSNPAIEETKKDPKEKRRTLFQRIGVQVSGGRLSERNQGFRAL